MIEDALPSLPQLFWLAWRPTTLAVLLAALGLVLLLIGRRAGAWPALLGLGWLGAVLATPLAAWLALPLEERFPRAPAPPARVDGVIVLGGAVERRLTLARGTPALNAAAERMTEAAALARRFPEARILFTGGSPGAPTGKSEADVARDFFAGLGLDGARVLFEPRARNTWENALFSLPMARPRPGETWLLVTSAAHMPRAMGVFRRLGWQVVPWPVNFGTEPGAAGWADPPFTARLRMAEGAAREYAGLLAYRIYGRTDVLFPAP